MVFQLSAPYTANQFFSSNREIEIQSALGWLLGLPLSRVNINPADIYTLRRRLLTIILPVTISGYATADAASAAASLINQPALANASGALANLTLVSPAIVTILVQSCPPGQFSSMEGSQGCNNCSAGLYSEMLGSSKCLLCTEGQFSTGAAETVCKTCSEGKYQTAVGATQEENCAFCLPGTYQSRQGMSDCTTCAEGKFSSGLGIITAANCSSVLIAETAATTDNSLLVPLLSTFLVLTALVAVFVLLMWRRVRVIAKKKTPPLATDNEARQIKAPTATLAVAPEMAQIRPAREAGEALVVPAAMPSVEGPGEDSHSDKEIGRTRKDQTSASKVGKSGSSPAASYSIEVKPVISLNPEITSEAYRSASQTAATGKADATPTDTSLEAAVDDSSRIIASWGRRKGKRQAILQYEISAPESVISDVGNQAAGSMDAAQSVSNGVRFWRPHRAHRQSFVSAPSAAEKSTHPRLDSPMHVPETADVSRQRNPDPTVSPLAGEMRAAYRPSARRWLAAAEQVPSRKLESLTNSGSREAAVKANSQTSATASFVLVSAQLGSEITAANPAFPTGKDSSQTAVLGSSEGVRQGEAEGRAVRSKVKQWRRRKEALEIGQQAV